MAPEGRYWCRPSRRRSSCSGSGRAPPLHCRRDRASHRRDCRRRPVFETIRSLMPVRRAVALGSQLDRRLHGVPVGAGRELLLARPLPLHRAGRSSWRQRGEILRSTSCLPPKPPHPFAEDAHVLQTEGKEVAELVPADERRLRGGADIQPPYPRRPRRSSNAVSRCACWTAMGA
jgi:hypothetical protein